uniref:Uncharacterized protein n=1 Tax=Arundo donax TaxID=35708 RepID=A0A0A9H5D4_ARUDO
MPSITTMSTMSFAGKTNGVYGVLD